MQRDEAWFATVYRAHEHAVRSYVYCRIGPDQVDDIVAEVFTTLWHRRDEAPARLLPWLYRVAANHIAHLTRSRARGARLAQKLISHRAEASYLDDDTAEAELLLEALDEADAELLRLAYWEELSPADIGRVLGISTGAVRVRLHRARKRAAALLDSPITPTTVITETDPSTPPTTEPRRH